MSKSCLDPHIAKYPLIDWGMLGRAVDHYVGLGFTQIEVPWVVPATLNVDTKPHSNQSFVLPYDMFADTPHELVGSAEQGFMYLIQQNTIDPGKYLSVSPCFRFDVFDSTHFPWFMKIELCVIPESNDKLQSELTSLVNQAASLFDKLCKKPSSFYNEKRRHLECQVVAINDTYDIEINGIEVGSYGIRSISDKQYVYGTGLALPRFTIARNE